jgi:hypothetical protein
MYGCSILIPHVNTMHYLNFCVEQIRKYRHPEIPQEIIIADQSPEAVFKKIQNLYSEDDAIQILRIPQVDAGYPIDMGLKYAQFDFFCTLDCDAFPIHRNWLYLPVRMIEKYNFSFVGNNSGLELSYKEKGQFFHINNFYRISRTALAQELSETVGFMRPGSRHRVGFEPKDHSWGQTAADNGVVAQWYTDQKKLGDKLSLELTSYVGKTNQMGVYGLVIDDLVFHMVFGWGEEWIKDMTETLGTAYLQLRDRMINEGFSEPLIRELIAGSIKEKRTRRINRQNIDPEIDTIIEQLKNSN